MEAYDNARNIQRIVKGSELNDENNNKKTKS